MIRINEIIKSMGSHNLLATPTGGAFNDPRLGPLLKKYLPGANGISAPGTRPHHAHRLGLRGSALGSRIELYERFYLGSIGRARALDHRKAQAAGETGAYKAMFEEIDGAARRGARPLRPPLRHRPGGRTIRVGPVTGIPSGPGARFRP